MQYNVLLIILSLYSFLQINLLLLIYHSQPIPLISSILSTLTYYCQISNTIKIKNSHSLCPLFASILSQQHPFFFFLSFPYDSFFFIVMFYFSFPIFALSSVTVEGFVFVALNLFCIYSWIELNVISVSNMFTLTN